MKKIIVNLMVAAVLVMFTAYGSIMAFAVGQRFDDMKTMEIQKIENYEVKLDSTGYYGHNVYVGPSDSEIAWNTFVTINNELFY